MRRHGELIELARVVARSGGIYASHIRSEEEGLLEAIDEAITIGKSAGLPVHISHLKANGKANWGKAGDAVQQILAARQAGQVVTADQYPYVASSTKLAAMVVPHWAIRGSGDEFARLAASADRGPLLRAEIQRELDRRDGGAAIRIARYAPRPGWVGRDLAAIARAEGITPLEVVLEIQRHGGAQAINFGMSEDDVRFIMRHDFVATASDGATHRPAAATGRIPAPTARFHARSATPLTSTSSRSSRPSVPARACRRRSWACPIAERSTPADTRTSSSSTPRRSATRPRSTIPHGMRRACVICS